MRCEEVRRRLERDSVAPGAREAVEEHLVGCPACRGLGRLYARVDQALRSGPVWEPPAGFAPRVAARVTETTRAGWALRAARSARAEAAGRDRASWRGFSWGDLQAAALGLLAAVFVDLTARPGGVVPRVADSLLSGRAAGAVDAYQRSAGLAAEALLAHADPVAWASAALVLGLTAWLARRSIA